MIDNNRTEFETTIRALGPGGFNFEQANGVYLNPRVNEFWKVWQIAINLNANSHKREESND